MNDAHKAAVCVKMEGIGANFGKMVSVWEPERNTVANLPGGLNLLCKSGLKDNDETKQNVGSYLCIISRQWVAWIANLTYSKQLRTWTRQGEE